ncbi:MAG: hypothetical protein IPH13_20540 [Planctomycetes bacterium]|nr:hypothetical protein [Planctomycetota bacterium]
MAAPVRTLQSLSDAAGVIVVPAGTLGQIVGVSTAGPPPQIRCEFVVNSVTTSRWFRLDDPGLRSQIEVDPVDLVNAFAALASIESVSYTGENAADYTLDGTYVRIRRARSLSFRLLTGFTIVLTIDRNTGEFSISIRSNS